MSKALACGWVALSALAAVAADFSVGRVDVKFAEEGWKEVLLPDSQSLYGGDRDGALSVQSKLFVRETPGIDDQVLILVSATQGGLGGGFMTYSPSCESDADEYREGNSGIRRPFAQCLSVLPRYTSESVFKSLAPAVLPLLSSGTVSVQRPVYSILSRHAISTGVMLDVRVFTTEPIAATGSTVLEPLPKGVPPEHVVWGRQLKDAVKSSVYSLSGRLDMPTIRRLAPLPPPAAPSVAHGG